MGEKGKRKKDLPKYCGSNCAGNIENRCGCMRAEPQAWSVMCCVVLPDTTTCTWTALRSAECELKSERRHFSLPTLVQEALFFST